MRRYSITIIAICSIILASCGNDPVTPHIITGTRQVITPIPDVPPLQLERFEFAWPRDANGAIITNSNVFIGLTQEDWEKLMRNLSRYAAQIRLYQQRIRTANALRQEINNAVQTNGSSSGTGTQLPTRSTNQ